MVHLRWLDGELEQEHELLQLGFLHPEFGRRKLSDAQQVQFVGKELPQLVLELVDPTQAERLRRQ